MKALPAKFLFVAGMISSIIIISFSNCGQSSVNKKANQPVAATQQQTAANNTIAVDQLVVTADTNSHPGGTLEKEILTTKEQTKPISVVNKESGSTKQTTVTELVVEKPVNSSVSNEDKPVDKVEEKPVKTEEVKITPANDNKTVDPPKKVETKTSQEDWLVPDKYTNMKDPYPADKESLDLGKSLYSTHCRSCHGNKGAGDGPKAAQIDTRIASFLAAEFKSQKPGEIFYKTSFGRKDMPKFEKKIPDEEERWAIVHYIMSLKN